MAIPPNPVFYPSGTHDFSPYTYPSVTYTNRILFTDDPSVIPIYGPWPVQTPTWNPLVVIGPMVKYAEQLKKFGSCTIQINTTPDRSEQAPAYVDVTYDGLKYKVQVGVPLGVPKNVYDTLQGTHTIATLISIP